MRHIPKSKYVGNHGGRYVDNDGLSKQFTYIDHDKKTKISTYNEEEKQQMEEQLKKWRDDTIAEILALPAVNAVKADADYEILIKRDPKQGVIWNEDVVIEKCIDNPEYRRVLHILTWRNTVKERYWFEDMSHEDIVGKKWEKWV